MKFDALILSYTYIFFCFRSFIAIYVHTKLCGILVIILKTIKIPYSMKFNVLILSFIVQQNKRHELDLSAFCNV